MGPCAVLAAAAEFVSNNVVWIFKGMFKGPEDAGNILFVHEGESALASDILRFEGEDFFQRRAVVKEETLAAKNGQHIERMFSECPEVFFAAHQFGLDAFAM